METSSIKDCVQHFREAAKLSELELRLGKYRNGKFTAGVERDVFEQLLSETQAVTSLVDEGDWNEIVDYHYVHSDRKTRTRVLFDSKNMDMSTDHIHKRPIADAILKHTREDEDVAFRVMTSQELPVSSPLPVVCIPTHVRIKQRRRFSDVRNGNVVWVYEFSKTWSANSRSAVEQLQHMSPPVYEIECELIDEKGEYLKEHDNDFVAKSLLLKGQMLCGDDVQDIMFEEVACKHAKS